MRRGLSWTAWAGRSLPLPAVPHIHVRSVSLQLGAHRVFDDLSLQVEGGHWHGILGRSGVGKSSLMRLLSGLQTPDRGTITTGQGGSLARQVAYMSQDDGLLPWATVLDNVQLGPRLRRQCNPATRERAQALLDVVGLSQWQAALPASLSGGMRQRVALARTLLENRPVVLMDEPFSRLDAITRSELQSMALRLLAQHTVILVTHDPVEALQLCNRVTVLQSGDPARLASFALESPTPRAGDSPFVMARLPELWAALQDNAAPVNRHTGRCA